MNSKCHSLQTKQLICALVRKQKKKKSSIKPMYISGKIHSDIRDVKMWLQVNSEELW